MKKVSLSHLALITLSMGLCLSIKAQTKLLFDKGWQFTRNGNTIAVDLPHDWDIYDSPDPATGAIQHPITLANSYVLPYDASAANWSDPNINIYTRNGGTNQKDLQNKIKDLENGEDCVVLASGVAALSGLFFAMLKSGDHVIFSSITYIAVYRLFNELFNEKFGVETTIVDVSDLDAVRAAIRPNTKLIHVETPGNPTLQVCDIKALARALQNTSTATATLWEALSSARRNISIRSDTSLR